MVRRHRSGFEPNLRIKETIWLVVGFVLTLPLITDRVSGWFLQGGAWPAG